MSGLDVSQSMLQPQLASLSPAINSGSSSPAQASPSNGGGLLSSASHLIAQYLSPSSSSSSSSGSASLSGSPAVSSSSMGGQQQQQSAMQQPVMSAQQASQYNEFASILDSMVAQTGVGAQQRQPMGSGQYGQQMHPQQMQTQNLYQASNGPQQQQPQQQQQPGGSMMMMSSGADQDMSGSSNIQSYLPAATQQQANQKSSMVSLAEQLAPGSQFNKLVSFPFSLSNNDDPSKEGRYKLHIPFLNSHVKRSDQQQQVTATAGFSQQQQSISPSSNSQNSAQSPVISQSSVPSTSTSSSSKLIPIQSSSPVAAGAASGGASLAMDSSATSTMSKSI